MEKANIIVKNDRIQIEKLQLGPFGTNAYLILCTATGDSILVDAPAEANRIIERLRGTNPRYILMTHSHMDHVGALITLHSKLKIPVAVHPLDASHLPLPPEIMLNDGDVVSLGNLGINVLHTPGHTPGSSCFMVDQSLLSGDTLFPGGPGKTRTPDDFRQIIESITKKIFVLPDSTQVYPGHGDSTVLKTAREEFAVFRSRSHDPKLCGDVLWLSS